MKAVVALIFSLASASALAVPSRVLSKPNGVVGGAAAACAVGVLLSMSPEDSFVAAATAVDAASNVGLITVPMLAIWLSSAYIKEEASFDPRERAKAAMELEAQENQEVAALPRGNNQPFTLDFTAGNGMACVEERGADGHHSWVCV